MKKENVKLQAVMDVFLPLLIYYLSSNIVLYFLNELVQWLVQKNEGLGLVWLYRYADAIRVVDNAVAMVVGAWFLRRHFVQEVCLQGQVVAVKTAGLMRGYISEGVRSFCKRYKEYVPVLCLSIASSITLNLLAQFGQVALYSDSFREVVKTQYAVSIGVGLVIYGVVSPLVEEMVFRGVVYHKCRRYLGIVPGIVLSSLLFGILHGNLVQGIYAFVMGVLITACYELYQSFCVPVLFHAGANIAVFTITYCGLIDTNQTAVISCVVFAVISIVAAWMIYNKRKA